MPEINVDPSENQKLIEKISQGKFTPVKRKQISRRIFLRGVGVAVGAAALAACTPAQETPFVPPTLQPTKRPFPTELPPKYVIDGVPFPNRIVIDPHADGSKGGDFFIISLFLNDTKVCDWKPLSEDPRELDQDKAYFTPNADNCPGLNENFGVVWELKKNKGQILKGTEEIGEVAIYFKDSKNTYCRLLESDNQ